MTEDDLPKVADQLFSVLIEVQGLARDTAISFTVGDVADAVIRRNGSIVDVGDRELLMIMAGAMLESFARTERA